MDDHIAKLFNLVKKNDAITVYAGDDIKMGSVAPYGISTGLAELDLYLGRKGGFPAGKVIELYGKPMCGKTSLALQHAAEVQKRGGLVIFIDGEKTFTPARARELGCNPENILKHEVDTVEDIFKVMHQYFGEPDVEGTKKKAKVGLLEDFDKPVVVIVDSITGVPTLGDVQGDIDHNDRPGHEAKQIKRGVRKINPMLTELKCKPSILFITHSVSKIGGFGKQTDSGGGLGIKFYASARVEFAHMANLKGVNDSRAGQKIAINIEKLKGGHLEYPKFTVELTNEMGFDKYESLQFAMIATDFAKRPSGSRTTTILPGTELEVQIPRVNFREWVDETGYDEVYLNWRRWCISEGALEPWGGADS
jgi:RecA/RadA recombinase